MELDRGHLHGPDDVGGVLDTQLVGGAVPAGEVHLHRRHPLRGPLGQPLLVDLLAGDAGGEAVQHARSVAQRTNDAVGDGQVVAGQVELGLAARREVHALGIGQAHRAVVDVELDG